MSYKNMGMFFVAGIGIALFIEFLLITKKNKSDSDKILTLWMFIILVHLFLFYLFYSGEIFRFPFLLGLEGPLPLLHGVFLFLYAGFLTDQLPEKRIKLLLHFIPVAAMYLYLSRFFILTSDQKIQIYKNHGLGFEVYMDIKRLAIALSGIIYVTLTVFLLRKHRNSMRDQFSDLEKVRLQWLWFLTIGMGGIWCLIALFANDILIYGGVVIFVFLIGFFGVRQKDVFIHNESTVENEITAGDKSSGDDNDPKKKYPKSGLTEELSQKLHRSLLDLMVKETSYRKSDLSISDLASKLGVHSNYLSQIINEKEGKNFYEFVNTYRVEEFKRLITIPENQQLTLLSLAFDCGFNSKSSFNRCFKKTTGRTPSEYFTAIIAEKTPS